MDETQKPFACKSEGCGMSFTNLDHLNVHTKKHAMVLHLSLGNKAAAYVGMLLLPYWVLNLTTNIDIISAADQTPTPTRLIRNCDEVGLFEDLHLQHVNPFEETFRQAVESKNGTPTLDHSMIMDEALPQDETTLHTPNVLPYIQYDLTNCTFKEESITMGDDVIASGNNNDLEDCYEVGSTGTTATNSELMDEGNSSNQSNYSDDIIVVHSNVASDSGNVKMKEVIVMDSNKARPPALILSKNQSSLSSSFKQIVDETLSDEIIPQSAQSLSQNIKTIIVKPLPKLTRILPMVPATTTADRIVKFSTTPKILHINLNETSKRLLLPKSKSGDEKPISVRDKLKATILKASVECDTTQSSVKQNSKSVINEKKIAKKDVADKTEDKLKVSRNRAAAKRYR